MEDGGRQTADGRRQPIHQNPELSLSSRLRFSSSTSSGKPFDVEDVYGLAGEGVDGGTVHVETGGGQGAAHLVEQAEPVGGPHLDHATAARRREHPDRGIPGSERAPAPGIRLHLCPEPLRQAEGRHAAPAPRSVRMAGHLAGPIIPVPRASSTVNASSTNPSLRVATLAVRTDTECSASTPHTVARNWGRSAAGHHHIG